ncbi:MAG: RNA polymerase factor sigma-54 [Tissierellia bacterium]|nr:RNA polymerase factor sigma-54 [Tissierellia bacterium]
MKMKPEIRLVQEQRLIMTTELRQSIMLLQLNSYDLTDFLKEELVDNPVLEMEPIVTDVTTLPTENKEVDIKDYFENYEDYDGIPNFGTEKREDYSLEAFTKYESTLYDYLKIQLDLIDISEEDREIAEILLGLIDSDGYIREDFEKLSEKTGISLERLEEVLEIIQSLDPLGIGARDIRECLLLQALGSVDYSMELEELILNHLENLAMNRVPKIAEALGVSHEKTQELIDIVRSFNPKPGSEFGERQLDTNYIVPDASIEKVDGEYVIILNDVTGPRLHVNSFYRRMMQSGSEQGAIDYLNDKYQRAIWIIKAIEQRRDTIYRVIQSIIDHQREFFYGENRILAPLTMKVVADDIEMHESTVSRAINGKYVQTPFGTYELRFFFTSALESVGGDVSSNHIKDEIKAIIEEENPKKPLSDQAIVGILNEDGIKISRRTIAKYRDEMNIPSSTMRKRY